MADGGKMIAISSGMGSIGENSGGWVPYRTSKAALNMAWSASRSKRSRAAWRWSRSAPGWVKTRMGGAGRGDHSEEERKATCAS